MRLESNRSSGKEPEVESISFEENSIQYLKGVEVNRDAVLNPAADAEDDNEFRLKKPDHSYRRSRCEMFCKYVLMFFDDGTSFFDSADHKLDRLSSGKATCIDKMKIPKNWLKYLLYLGILLLVIFSFIGKAGTIKSASLEL